MKKKRAAGVILRITQQVEKHYRLYFALVIGLALCFPAVVWLMYSVLPPIVYTDISADGMLSYFGSIAGGLITLFAAFIAVYQSRKEMEAAQEQAEKQRLADVRPCLQVELHKLSEESSTFDFRITNCGEKCVLDIYLYHQCFTQYLLPHESFRRRISFDDRSDEVYFDAFDYEFVNGYPKDIDIVCKDIDNNLMTQRFNLYIEDGNYIYQETGEPRYEEV